MASLTALGQCGYTQRMAKRKRTARFEARIYEETRDAINAICEVMQWSLSDFCDESAEWMQKRRDVKEAMAKPKQEGE